MSEATMARVQAAEACRQHALDLIDAGQLSEGLMVLRCAVACNPRNSRAWNDLGVVLETSGNALEAVRCYRRSIALEPGRSEARQNLGMLLLQIGLAQAFESQALTSSFAF
jgi:Flp pilus assembly protein TadD